MRFEQDPNFVGREDELGKIEERFKEQHRVVLSGIGGVGYVMSTSAFEIPDSDTVNTASHCFIGCWM